jgi:cephalosporin hydroxylase/glycosyltransferase involved in cell wall biosynthesis
VQRFAADLHQVRDGFDRFGLLDDSVRFLQGPPAEMLREPPIERLAAVRFGEGLGTALGPALEAVQPLLAPGAEVIVSGTGTEAVETALIDARARLGIDAPLERVDWNSVGWRMPLDPPIAAAPGAAEESPGGLRLQPAPTPGAETVSLSVVVVFYNMAREARRTLLSLSRTYQRDIEDLDYEVIVVDNGSAPDQRLTVDEVRSYGPEFHLLDMGTNADPSPVRALNAGIAHARGTYLALMIDGAHVLTPGVLHHGMIALDAYAPAVVATQQWYVGPGQQDEMVREGYDREVEDGLFRRIDWPIDGYRLFEISHFIGERDWFDGIIESNCVFVPRKLLEQVGGFDERFSMPGGGYANLDLFERLTLAPGVSAASMIGEGSFHQFHGGTTTNVVDEVQHRERVASYGEHFAELRGRRLLGTDRPIKYVGALDRGAAKRTRARRAFPAQLDAFRDPVDHDADVSPIPVAEELRLAAIEATWDRKAWKEATWLGHRVNRYPADLHSYQELLFRHRPEVVILTGEDDGLEGRARFVAGVLEQIGHGRVVAVGPDALDAATEHERVTQIPGRPDDPEVAARVRNEVGAATSSMVFLALGEDRRVMAAFEHYADLVPPGGYVVVENTVVNGRPAGAGFGAGPLEAVFQLIARHPEFVIDHTLEQFTITFNRNGFLRRLENV